MIFLQGFIKFDQGISENVSDKLLAEERKKNNNKKKRSKHNMSHKLRLGAIISHSGAGDKFVLVGKTFPSTFSLVVADKHVYRGNLMLRM